jgi:hypothetical protein
MKNRKFTRANCSFGASIRYGNELAICKADNLSLRGMHLKSDHDIPLNASVNVTVYKSSHSSLKVDAKVVRKEAGGVGLEISRLNANTFAQLRDIVAENSMAPGKVMQETYSMLKYIQ